ncbi:MAG: orotidine-5'-phosphate decarboxylase [Phycisphaera sp.]|nr:MAG: orotidine-5'-phosphate decarboxylase [Phycisphaera sp.]
MDNARFVDRLHARIAAVGSPTCIGLDPVIERIPEDVRTKSSSDVEAVEQFCLGVIDATCEHASAFKPQSACFERFGSAGVAVLERVTSHARSAGVPVVLDAKRGDIGISAAHYAEAVKATGADSVTVNAYLGPSTVEPYLEAGLGVFVLVRTSNPDSDAVQSNELSSGGTVGEMMASHVARLGANRLGESGMSDVGAVVGLTKSADGEALRGLMPRQYFLVPGYGAQGGGAEDLRPLLCEQGGVLVNASRSVLYPERGENERWQDAVARAAKAMHTDLASVMS